MELRTLGPQDWQAWRALRLHALAQAPYAFGSVLADWQGAGDAEDRWRQRLETTAYNVIAVLDGSDVGMASGTELDADGTAELISMWVEPQARGRGVAAALVSAVVEEATGRGATRVLLWVSEGNDVASRVYRRCGFVDTGNWAPMEDGRREQSMVRVTPMTTPPDVLADWVRSPFTAEGITHDCYRAGSGPAVVLLPEIPGMIPAVMDCANRIREAGFTVVVPSLYGTPGRAVSAGYIARVLPRLCISREFAAFGTEADRPVVRYVTALARQLHSEIGGPGVGVIGMCYSGGFALATAYDPVVVAPVGSQPSVPFPVGGARKSDLGMSAEQADLIEQRTQAGLCLLGLRFSEDKGATRERFAALRARFGEAFEVIEIDSSPGNPEGFKKSAHSVLSADYRDDPESSTYAANARVIAFLRERLL